MFHVLFYVRPFAFPRWAFRAIRVIRVIWFIRTMLLATMYMA